jgi:hypothetical protein
LGALGAAAALVPRVTRRWGATAAERAASLPGDELVPNPRLRTDRAIGIDAPPAVVWPWLVQIGMGRGGWYSYDNFLQVGSSAPTQSATGIVPELQQLEEGDTIDLIDRIVFRVATLDPGRALVLYSDQRNQPTQPFTKAWSFVLTPEGPGGTRLLVRESLDWPTRGVGAMMYFADWLSFFLTRRFLLNLRDLIETAFTADDVPPAPPAQPTEGDPAASGTAADAA